MFDLESRRLRRLIRLGTAIDPIWIIYQIFVLNTSCSTEQMDEYRSGLENSKVQRPKMVMAQTRGFENRNEASSNFLQGFYFQ